MEFLLAWLCFDKSSTIKLKINFLEEGLIKIVQVLTDSNIGGAGKYLVEFLKCCDREKYENCIFLPKNALIKSKIEQIGIKVEEIEGISEKSFSFLGILNIKKKLGELRPDILHAHSCLAARIAGKIQRCKVIYTKHYAVDNLNLFNKEPLRTIFGIADYLTSDHIIATAKAAEYNLISHGVSHEKITTILNGVTALRKFSEEEIKNVKKTYNIPKNFKIVAIIARLTPTKRQNLFIEAARFIIDTGLKNVKFLLSGIGESEFNLRTMIKGYGLEEFFIFVGFVENIEIITNIIDIQVNCAESETSSLSLLEGMSIGKPAVVVKAGGNGEVIKNEENGLTVPPRNSKKLAEAIIRLLTDKDLYEKLSKKSLEIYKKKFTAKIMTKKIEEIYDVLINSR